MPRALLKVVSADSEECKKIVSVWNRTLVQSWILVKFDRMQETTAKADLFNPGAAENFFDISGLPHFAPGANRAFHQGNALWLAEFSRLIYRQDRTEKKSARITSRTELLAAQEWEEMAFIQVQSVEAAIFRSHALSAAVLVFRGTLGIGDTLTDMNALMSDWRGVGKIHCGFRKDIDRVWPLLVEKLKHLDLPIFITGHSLGGALATLAAALLRNEPRLPQPAAVYTFGSPRVGDREFAESLHDLFHCRVVNGHDVVPKVPLPFSMKPFPVYQHTGELHRMLADGKLSVSPFGSDFLEDSDKELGMRDFLQRTAAFLKGSLTAGERISQAFLDHAPVNYIARLERLQVVI